MKFTTCYGIKGMHGNKDGMIFYTLPNCSVVIGRSMPTSFTEAENHDDYRKITRNISDLMPTQEFKNDFKVYTAMYKDLPTAKKSISSWYNIFVKMLWAMQKEGLVNLKTLTKAEIYSQNLPCKSVKTAVEAGYLPQVTNYTSLDSGI